MLTQKSFQIGTIALNYVEGPPAGPPLLLLHGITQRWQEFIQMIPALTMNYHVYALDFRGHGMSGRQKGSYQGETYGQDTLEFINKVVGAPVIVFGHSLGGMVSLYLSAHHPDLFRAQILSDCIVFSRDISQTVLPGMFSQVYELIAAGKSYEQLRVALPEMCLESPVLGKA